MCCLGSSLLKALWHFIFQALSQLISSERRSLQYFVFKAQSLFVSSCLRQSSIWTTLEPIKPIVHRPDITYLTCFPCNPPPSALPSLGSQQSVASLSSAPVSVTGVGAGAGYKYSHPSIRPVSRDQHQGAINIGSEPFSQISKPIISTQHFRNFERVISFGFPMQCNVISKKFCFVIFSKVSYNVIQEIV